MPLLRSSETVIGDDGHLYVSSAQAAKTVGLDPALVVRLCRDGVVQALLIGMTWYLFEPSLYEYLNTRKAQERPRTPGSENVRHKSPSPVVSSPKVVTLSRLLPMLKPLALTALVLISGVTTVYAAQRVPFAPLAREVSNRVGEAVYTVNFTLGGGASQGARGMLAAAGDTSSSVTDFFSHLFNSFLNSTDAGNLNEIPADAQSQSVDTGKNVGTYSTAPSVATSTSVVEPVVERVLQPQYVTENVTKYVTLSGVSQSDLDTRLNQLENKLASQIAAITSVSGGGGSASAYNYGAIFAGLSNIDTLPNVTITNPTITGGSISNTSGISESGASSLSELSDIATLSPSYGNLLYYDGSEWTTIATSSLGISSGSSSFGQGWVITDGALTPTTTLGILVSASSTFSSNVSILGDTGIGTSSPFAKLTVWGAATGNIFEAATNSSSTAFLISNAGLVGIGTTSPWAQFSLNAPAGISAFAVGSSTSLFNIDQNGHVGIGTTSPWRRFSVVDTVSDAQVSIAYDATRYAQFRVGSEGDLFISSQGADTRLNDENLWVCAGGACDTGSPLGNGNLLVETAVGIASTTPWGKLSVGADGAIVTTEKTLTDGASIAVDWRNGNQQKVTLGGSRTITFSGYLQGQTLRLVLCQDSTGSRTVSWGTQILWSGGSVPTLTTTANKCDVTSFIATMATSTLKIFGAATANF